MGKHWASLLAITAIALCASGQRRFVSSLESNMKQYKPQYAEITNTNATFNEHLYPHIMILEEEYELSPNAISYYEAISSMDEATKQSILKAHAEIRYVAESLEISDYPAELLWLPFAISAYDKNYSKDGNYGIWGLQYLYAIKYGACINECTDERQDIKIATKAAIRQLMYNKKKFGKWDLALAAYIYGAQKLKLQLDKNSKVSNIYTSLDPYGNNIFDIWCALISWSHNFEKFQPTIAPIAQDYDTVCIQERIHIEQISAVLGINPTELKSLNASFNCEIIDGRRTPVTFKLPNGLKDDFKNLHDSIIAYNDSIYFPKPKLPEEPKEYTPDPDKYGKITYTIRQGDYLGKIAQKYHVSISDIQKWNNLNGTNITAGKTLIIWTQKSAASTTKPSSSTDTKQGNVSTGLQLYETYTVKSGDSPYSIAKRYDWATADDILKWNNISDPSKLQIGQKLKIYK